MVIDVPSRVWSDPVLNCRFATGDEAVRIGQRFIGGALATDIETPGLIDSFTINCVTMAWVGEDGRVVSILLDPRRNRNHHALVAHMYSRADSIIGHNLPFDTPPLFHAGLIDKIGINTVIDTVVLARFAMPEPPPFGQGKKLEQLATKLLGHTELTGGMERAFKAAGYKTIQSGFEGMDIDSPIYRQGAMADTAVTLALEPVLRELCLNWTTDHPFDYFGAKTRAEAAEILGVQETVHRVMLRRSAVGLAVDLDYLDRYAEGVDAERIQATAELAAHGLDAGKGKGAALIKYLDSKGELPQPWPRTPTGNLRATKVDLEILAETNHLAAAQRRVAEIEQVQGYLDKVARQAAVTGRCHPQVATLGASATGRMSVSEPPYQQFNADARPIICDDGQGLTSIDWSQIEPVTMANMAKDLQFLAAYEAGEDLYEPIQLACGLSMDKKGRDVAKVVLLSTMYGAGIPKIAAQIGHTEESAAQIKRQMFSAMPKCERWMSKVEEVARVYGRAITAGGRILPVDEGGIFKAVNYCLSPHTSILRADLTHVRADSIRPGDRLVAFDEHPEHEGTNLRRYHQMRTAVAERVSTVVKPTVVVSTDDGMKTGCSDDHLWLVRPIRRRKGLPLLQWRKAIELMPGDELLSVGRWHTDTSRTAGYVAGLLDGEGHMTRNVDGQRKSCQVGFSQLAGPVMDAYLKAMAELGLPTKHRPRTLSSTSPTDAATTSGIRNVMRLIGTTRPERFLARSESIYEGRSITAGLTTPVKVLDVKLIGETKLTSIQTSTRTLIANGYLSHNCVQGSAYDVLAHTIERMEADGIGDSIHLALHDEVVVDTEVAEHVQQIMATPPPFLLRWTGGRVPILRTDRADMADHWQKV